MQRFNSTSLDLVENLVPLVKNVKDTNILLGFLNQESGEFILHYYPKSSEYDYAAQCCWLKQQQIPTSDQPKWIPFFISHQVKEDGEDLGTRWSEFRSIDKDTDSDIYDLLKSRLNEITQAINKVEWQIDQLNRLAEDKAHQAEMKQVSDRLSTLSVSEQEDGLRRMPPLKRFHLFDYLAKLQSPLSKEIASLAALTKSQYKKDSEAEKEASALKGAEVQKDEEQKQNLSRR